MILFRVFKDKFMMIIFKNCSNGSINIGDEDNLIKYSLIVSIETKETEIYSAVETAIANAIGVQIMQET